MKLKLDEHDIDIVIGGLTAAYGGTTDAISARAGAPYGYNRPRREPTEIDTCIERLDRIERMAHDLGRPLPAYCYGHRRDSVRFWHEQSDVWSAEEMLAGGGA